MKKLKLSISLVFTGFCAVILDGKPDPNLFDGRFSSTTPEALDTASETIADAEVLEDEEGSAKAASETAGNAVEAEATESAEAVAADEGAGADENVEVAENAKGVGSTAQMEESEGTEGSGNFGDSGGGASSTGTTTSPTRSGRSFDVFTVGAANETNGPIEVKRSKDIIESSTSGSRSSSQTTSSQTQDFNEDRTQSGSDRQENYEGAGNVDYGTNVPSGL